MNGETAWWGAPPTGDEFTQEGTCDPCTCGLSSLTCVFWPGSARLQRAADETEWFAAMYPNTAEAAILAPAPGYLRPITDAVQLPVP